jgi:geranylgeranyl pyrophosphate synthase
LARRGMLEPTDLEQAYNLLRKIGALEYTTVFIDLYWEHALTCLRQAGCAEDSLLFDLLKHLRGD